jgi:hypothetical protein
MEKVVALSCVFGLDMCFSLLGSISVKLVPRLKIDQWKFGSLISVFMFTCLIGSLTMGAITDSVDGMDEGFQPVEDARLFGASGKNLQERLQGIKAGAEIFLTATKRDDKSIDATLKPAIGPYGATLAPEMPVGAVVVPAEEGALAKAISSHGSDTVFYLKAGIHTGNGEIRPKAGSVFIGETGAILDGGNATAKCFIHDVGVIPYTASAPRYVVTLRNIVVRNYSSADQECAVMAQDSGQGWPRALSDPADRNGWLLEHCTFTSNRAGGAYLGSASTARDPVFGKFKEPLTLHTYLYCLNDPVNYIDPDGEFLFSLTGAFVGRIISDSMRNTAYAFAAKAGAFAIGFLTDLIVGYYTYQYVLDRMTKAESESPHTPPRDREKLDELMREPDGSGYTGHR